MFSFSIQFHVIDRVTRAVNRINDRLDVLRRNADRAADRLRSRLGRANLRARITLDLALANRQIQRLQQRIRNIGNSGRNLAQGGMGMLMAGAGFAAAALIPIDVARKYELAFKDVKKSLDGTDEQLDALYQSMKQFKGVSFEDMSVAYAEAGKMGFDASNVAGFADGVIKGATALDFSVEAAIGQVGKILAMTNQMETAVESSQDIMDKVVNLENNLAGVKGSGVIDVWKRNADLYNSLGFDNAEMGALSGFLEQNFVASELGASGFKMMINQFKKLEPELGFMKRIETGGLDGLKSVIEEISKMSATDQLDTFGVGAMELINKLQSAENMKKLDFALEVSLNSSGAVDKEWAVFRGTYDEKVNDAKKKWLNFMETLGKPMMGIAGGILDKLIPFFDRMTVWAENNKELTKTLMTVVLVVGVVLAFFAILAIVIGGIGMAIGTLAPLLTIITGRFGLMAAATWLLNAAFWANPITWIIIGIVALIAVIAILIYYFDDWSAWIVKIFNEFLQIGWVQTAIQVLGAIVATTFAMMKVPFDIFIAAWGILWDWVQRVWEQMGGFSGALSIVQGAIGMVGSAFSALISPITTVIGWLDKFLAKFEIYNKAKGAISGAWNTLTGGDKTGKVDIGGGKSTVDVNVTASKGATASAQGRGGVNLRTANNGLRG